MKVSIITIAYNSASTIRETIVSVIGQTYSDVEYILIDGGSTDGTIKIIEEYAGGIARLVSEPDEGIYDAMNKGIEVASGDIVGILNSDDIYAHSGVISNVVREFKNSGAASIYGDLIYVDKEKDTRIKRRWKSGAFRRKAFLNGWMPPHPAFFVKKQVYEDFGLYNTRFKISADYEFMLRVLYKGGISAQYLPEVLVQMKTGGQSNVSLKNRLLANREDREAWRINNLKPRPWTFMQKPLRKLGQFIKT